MLRKWSYRSLPFIALVLWAACVTGHYMAERQLDPVRISALMQEDLRQRERKFKEIDRHRDDVQAWMQQKVLSPKLPSWVFGQDFGLYAYRGDSLIAWTTSSVLPAAGMTARGKLHTLSNGIYYGYSYTADWLPRGVSLSVLFPVVTKYPLANDYLQAGFAASSTIDPRTTVTDTPGKSSSPLYAPNGHALGFVNMAHGMALPHLPAAWIMYCWALALLAACTWVHVTSTRLARKGHAGWAIALVAATIILVRGLIYARGLPFHLGETTLFSPRLYGSSKLLNSLGDLLLNTLALLWFIAFIASNAPLRKWYEGSALPPVLRWVAALSAYVLLAEAAMLFVRLIRSLVLDSIIPFDSMHLSSLDRSSLAGLLITNLLIAILLTGISIARSILEALLPKMWAQTLVIVSAFTLVLIIRSGEGLMPIYTIVCLWLTVVIVGQHIGRQREARGAFRAANLFWSIAHCLLLTFLLLSFTRSREMSMRRAFAERIATRQDDALEYNFSQLEPYIRSDTALRHFLQHPTQKGRDSLEDRLATLYFNNSFAAYKAQIYLFDVSNKPVFPRDTTSITELVSVTQEEVPSRATPSLYYRPSIRHRSLQGIPTRYTQTRSW